MNLICKFSGHKWHGCKCLRCGEVRDQYHLWNMCHGRCPVCGKTRPPEHSWNGCKCKVCGATRDEMHSWDRCHGKCRICGKSCDISHSWNGCKCKICGATRDMDHLWQGSRCAICGATRPLPVAEHASLAEYAVGEGIAFGQWKGKKLIWRVLAVEEERMLLITDACLGPRPFSRTTPATWDKSTLRGELNGDWFYASPDVFSDAERAAILAETHDSPGIYYQNKKTWEELYTSKGGEVEDRVFLLSVAEACKYFHATREEWLQDAMGYRAYQFPISEELAAGGSWWLRNATRKGAAAVNVLTTGMANYNGYSVTEAMSIQVRPAIWVSRKA